MNDCPKCGSNDIDVAPARSGKDLECQECGKRFNAKPGSKSATLRRKLASGKK